MAVVGGVVDGETKKTHRVSTTQWWPWWVLWSTEKAVVGCLGWRDQINPPTSPDDSLVVVVGEVVGGEAKKAHQRVIKTCWWRWWVKNLPTSHWDSLVACRCGVVVVVVVVVACRCGVVVVVVVVDTLMWWWW